MEQQKKKREISTLQKLTNSQKRVANYKSKNLPTVKEAMHIRTTTLAIQYLERQTDINKEIMTLANYCKKYNISETTLRRALKELTGSDKKINPACNNIQKYQKEKKALFTKVALEGEDSLTESERVAFIKLKESETRRLEKINEKLKLKEDKKICKLANNVKDINLNSDSLNNVVKSKKQEKLKGGAKVVTEEIQEDDSEDDSEEEMRNAVKIF